MTRFVQNFLSLDGFVEGSVHGVFETFVEAGVLAFACIDNFYGCGCIFLVALLNFWLKLLEARIR